MTNIDDSQREFYQFMIDNPLTLSNTTPQDAFYWSREQHKQELQDYCLKVWQASEARLLANQKPKCPICNDSGQYCVGNSGDERDGNAPILERCDCEVGQPNNVHQSEGVSEALLV